MLSLVLFTDTNKVGIAWFDTCAYFTQDAHIFVPEQLDEEFKVIDLVTLRIWFIRF
jgi:hypothetical protein